MILHGTPLSHFTRKVRVLLAELEIPYEMSWARSVLASSPTDYADNPLLRVPSLVDGPDRLIESNHIARHLVARFDPSDRLGVRSERVEDLNRLAVIDGIMDNEVVLILAKRGGVTDLHAVAYFRKLFTAIDNGLAWLDARISSSPFDYRDIALVCLHQHLAHYDLLPLDPYPHLAARVASFAARPSIASTTPEASLAAARAAGWQPG